MIRPAVKPIGIPRRHAGRRFAGLSLIIVSCILFAAVPALAQVGQEEIKLPELSEVVCQSYLVYDRTKGEVIISQNPDQKIYPASMTKIMTAALALEHLSPDQTVTVSQTAIDGTTSDSSLMGLVVGEETTVNELLFGLMLPSGNDAANVLGEAVADAVYPSGQTDAATGTAMTKLAIFVGIMNQKAAEIGLTNTHYMNAHGLHDENHYTTADDLEKVFDYALSFDDFRTLISSPTHVFTATNMHLFDGWAVVRNTNPLLSDPWMLGTDTRVAEVVGGKTGTTSAAGTGMTLLAVDQNGDELITVVCGIPYASASRLTTYVAAVLNAGASSCYEKDPVVRVEGTVMDNKPDNAPAAQLTTDTSAPTPTETPVTQAPTIAVVTQVPAETQAQDTGSLPASAFQQHPAVTIAVIVLLCIILVLVIVYFAANRRKKNIRRNSSGIRRL